MARREASRWLFHVIHGGLFTAILGCGGQTTGTATHVDVGSDAAAGGSRNSGLVACNDGTGNNDCCPSSAVEGGTCDVRIPRCSRGGCHAGFTSYLYCGGGTWSAGQGLFPCSIDAGSDGAVSQMSCGDLHAAWTSFRETHGQCTLDSDCTTFLAMDPTSDPCGNPPGLNAPVNKQFLGDAQQYADRYFKIACGGDPNTFPNATSGFWNDFGFDGGTLANPRCFFSNEAGSCTADTPSCITPPTIDGGSGGDLTCGSQTCSTNQFCVQQMCGGGPNPCVPLPDAGTCPTGWTFDPSCPRSTLGGCDPPACTNPPPYCADIPSSCVSLPTGPTASCPCADSLCKFGSCVEMAGRNVTCAAQ